MNSFLERRNARLMSLCAGAMVGLSAWISSLPQRPDLSDANWMAGMIMLGMMAIMVVTAALWSDQPGKSGQTLLGYTARLRCIGIGLTIGIAIGIAIEDGIHQAMGWERTLFLCLVLSFYGCRLAMRQEETAIEQKSVVAS